MIIDYLQPDVRLALLRGYYELPESDDKATPEAFSDGRWLRNVMRIVYAADTVAEARELCAKYDEIAGELNAKYGDIVILEADAPDGVLGFRGYRWSPFTGVTTYERQSDGTMSKTFEDLQARAAEEDAQVRAEHRTMAEE